MNERDAQKAYDNQSPPEDHHWMEVPDDGLDWELVDVLKEGRNEGKDCIYGR